MTAGSGSVYGLRQSPFTAKLDFVRKGSRVLIEPGPVSKKFRLDLLDFSFSFLIKFALDSPYRLGPFEKLTGNELE